MLSGPGREVAFDGASLSIDSAAPGRRFLADGRCLEGNAEPVAWANVCASPDPAAKLRFDEPEVQFARREVLAWWIPLLGDDLICLTTLALDASHFGGAITVVRTKRDLSADPFARLFPSTQVEANDLFNPVPPPGGPVIERYAGAPWPGGRFGA